MSSATAKADTAANGTKDAAEKAVELALPVGTLAEAVPLLRRPFTPQAVKFKVQATWDGGALVVP